MNQHTTMVNTLKVTTTALLTSLLLGACQSTAPKSQSSTPANVAVSIFAINDFHGNLEPGNFSAPGLADQPVLAGGAAYIATLLKQLEDKHPNHVIVGAGDLIGASPLLSSILTDRPALKALSALGLQYSAAGNHEFDYGSDTLLAMQNGGCAQPGCDPELQFERSGFQYLSSNVRRRSDGQLIFPARAIERFGDVQLGIIGASLRETPTISLAKNVATIEFGDEADAINQQVSELKAQGVRSIVVLIHQGGESKAASPKEISCEQISGDILPVMARLDPEVDVVISGHSHKDYVCRYQLDGKNILLTQGASYGRVLTQIDLQIDPVTNNVVQSSGQNLLVDSNALTPDPQLLAIIADAKAKTDTITQKLVSYIPVPSIRRSDDGSVESDLSRLAADAHWAATKAGGADFALVNYGGVRTDLPNVAREKTAQGYAVLVADVYAVQPFGNDLYVLALSGTELLQVLNMQVEGGDRLTGSNTLSYKIDRKRPAGQRIIDVNIAGAALDPNKTYKVAINSYLASGGSKQTLLKDKPVLFNGGLDRDALASYLKTNPAPASYQQARSTYVD